MNRYAEYFESKKNEERKGPNGEVPGKGKIFLRVPHYRLVEIDESEMDDFITVIKNGGGGTCEDIIINTFFKHTKKIAADSMTNRLSDKEVKELWEQFKELSTCLLRMGGM